MTFLAYLWMGKFSQGNFLESFNEEHKQGGHTINRLLAQVPIRFCLPQKCSEHRTVWHHLSKKVHPHKCLRHKNVGDHIYVSHIYNIFFIFHLPNHVNDDGLTSQNSNFTRETWTLFSVLRTIGC